MSQHRWATLDGWNALAGFDAVPRSHYFFMVSRECPSCAGAGTNEYDDPCATCREEGEVWAYNNLRDPRLHMGEMSLEQFVTAVKRYLTEWPVDLFANLVFDALHLTMNTVQDYPATGRVQGLPPARVGG